MAIAVRVSLPNPLARGLAVAGAWVLSEMGRGVILTGFPWLALGYAHTDDPLAGYAPLLGVYGVEALSTLVALALVVLARSLKPPRHLGWHRLAPPFAAAVLVQVGALLQAAPWSVPAGPPLRARLVQGNVPQDLKFGEQGMDLAEQTYLPTLSTAPGAAVPDLIVWPESAFPVPINDLPDNDLTQLFDDGLRPHADLVLGAFIVERGPRYFNSAIGITHGQAPPQRYSKRHLVPFGEFVPWGMHWFVTALGIPMADQESGADVQPVMSLAGQTVAVNICFEDVFGAEIRRAWADAKLPPTVLLNLSNLAWFDDSIGLPQHLQMSRMRALETARPLLRATNTGVTAAIDAKGQVLAQLPLGERGILEALITPQQGTTPFVRWGNGPTALLALFSVLLGSRLGRLNRRFGKL
jgi:apolipoprotein N-acyltransferase